jgi:ABC-2 type transport system permease protein
VALIAAVFSVITFLPYLLGGSLGETPGKVIASYVSFIYFIVILAATLFASVVIVSEFEERTALILFTRPVKKTSIFVGKVMGCLLLETVMIVLFYAGMAVTSVIVAGSVDKELLISLGLTFLFTVATSGVAVFISSVMKKGSTCAILTFVFLLLLLPILTQVINVSTGADMWFMLDQTTDAISTCIPAYVDQANERLQHLIDLFGWPEEAFDSMMIKAPDLVKTVGTMIGWSVVSLVLAWIAFIRREF